MHLAGGDTMNLAQLRHLVALADTLSFSKAAERVHVTQPALSRSVQQLEDELGGRLIHRIGRRNELTSLGHASVERARRILFEVAELGEQAQRANPAIAMRVGLGAGAAAVLMAPLMRHMAQHHPQGRLTLTRGPLPLQIDALRARELDALIVDMRPLPASPELAIEPLPPMRAGAICRAGHPLAARQAVTIAMLRRHPVASTLLSDEIAQELVRRFGHEAHPREMVSLRCEEVSACLDVVRTTDAVFLGIVAAAQEGLRRGELVELPLAPALTRSGCFAIVTLAGRSEPALMQMLRRLALAHMGDTHSGAESLIEI